MSLKTTNKIDANTYELEIEISAEKFEEALQKAYLKSKSKIAVPGFRKGKAPRKVIEKTYGENCFYEDAVNLLYGEAVGGAVEEANLELVCQPEVDALIQFAANPAAIFDQFFLAHQRDTSFS